LWQWLAVVAIPMQAVVALHATERAARIQAMQFTPFEARPPSPQYTTTIVSTDAN